MSTLTSFIQKYFNFFNLIHFSLNFHFSPLDNNFTNFRAWVPFYDRKAEFETHLRDNYARNMESNPGRFKTPVLQINTVY